MRIIAGKYRRRKLQTNRGLTTRPITDRAKEIVFERLGDDLEGWRVADIFAGTGTIGLEALSRGVASVVFIENDRRAHELLNRNVEMLGVDDSTLCWKTDVLRCSFRPKGVEQLFPYDLIFFDPPFPMLQDLKPGTPLFRSMERLSREDVSQRNVLLILRTPQHSSFECPPCWEKEQELKISSMAIHFYRKQGSAT